ncbi:dhal domain-containing protein, partial [Cunninghamella echinulata]
VTEYDTILGDGDFGQTLKAAGEAIQQNLNNYPFYSYSKTILALAETIDHSVGGTAAAIFCIYLNALATGLNKYDDSSSIPSSSISLSAWSKASLYALNSLQTYTLARQGDRTMMDTLIPFVETFQKEPHSLTHAIQAAHQGMLSTKTQIAKLGRSSYLSNDDVQNANIPDPGAYGLDIILEVIKDSLA